MQLNDCRQWQYHRNNGVTKVGFNQNAEKEEKKSVSSKLTDVMNNQDRKDRHKKAMYITRSIEGQLQMADLLNQAYIKELFPETHILTGIQFMPFQPSMDMELERMVNLIGALIFPVNLCLSLPVFIYTLVMEKELKLVENMKINGLQMRNYWFVNFVFDYLLYWITTGIFWFCSAFVFNISYFRDTNFYLLFSTLFAWGLSQVSIAFFLSVFLNSS